MTRFFLLSGVLLLCACQEVPVDRPVADALDKITADSREARISNLSYDLFVDIAASDIETVGEVDIQFDLSDATSDLTLDFTGGTLNEININGNVVAADYNGYFITLPGENLQSGSNLVTVSYRRPYGHDGTGLHRFEDPEDGLTYMHSYLWPYYANRLLPSFDQPSLKANFSLRVVAPDNWIVVSTMPGTAQTSSADTQLWTFAATPKISSYAFSLHAGSYKVWTDDSGNVPLRLMARQSLAEYVAVDEWFELTQKGMTYYKDYFDIPYPFEKYDQLIVPEFNIGGMENIAAVTYTEAYVQRQESSRAEREGRAGTVLHELAHMWFGDLVTHEWWNGMWLNESFATQMATLAQIETTEFTNKWHGYFTHSKSRAYYRDSRVTTHPIEMSVDSTDMFTTLFDAITYEKGGSVLKQLQYRVGAENYRLAVSAYLMEFSFANTELADFIRFQSETSGIDLGDWSDEWLLQPGFNTLAAAPVCADEQLQSVTITQTAPEAWPTIRTHKTELALYDFDKNGDLVVTYDLPITIDSAYTEITVPDSTPCPALINPNYNDWTFAEIRISADDEVVLGKHLGKIKDPLSRSMFLAALVDKAVAGEMPIATLLRLALTLAAEEENIRVLEQVTATLSWAVQKMQRLSPETDQVLPRLLDDVESMALNHAHFAPTPDLKKLWFNLFLDVASSDAAVGTTRALLDGKAEVDGIEISSDIRWRLLRILSQHDAPEVAALLDAEIKRDPSDLGQRNLLGAQAAAPNADNKERWIYELQSPKTVTNLAKQRAIMFGLFPATQTDLQLDLLTKILSSLPQMSRDTDQYFLKSYASAMLTPMCRLESNALMQTTLGTFREELNPTALGSLREALQADMECQALRAKQ